MKQNLTIKKIEVVVWLGNLKPDQAYLTLLEMSWVLNSANIRAMPNKYQQQDDKAIIQYYIPESDFDIELIKEILYNELKDSFVKVVWSKV